MKIAEASAGTSQNRFVWALDLFKFEMSFLFYVDLVSKLQFAFKVQMHLVFLPDFLDLHCREDIHQGKEYQILNEFVILVLLEEFSLALSTYRVKLA